MFADRWYQTEAISSLFQYFYNNPVGNPVVAMPTGTGKSVVIAKFIQQALQWWPQTRIMALTHVKELIDQNAKKLQQVWPLAPVGIYSAGLRRKDKIQPIIFGGNRSVVNCVEDFGHIDLLLIDEAHLVSPNVDASYGEIIRKLTAINPHLRIIGFTATPWRTGIGHITNGGIFTDVCYDITTVDSFRRLIYEGYLAPLIPQRTTTKLDTSNVGMQNGDYNLKELQNAVDKDSITQAALSEFCYRAQNRSAWLLFSAGVEHAEHISGILAGWGIDCPAVHGAMPAGIRDERIAAFKAGRLRGLVNNNVLTTGFDHPPVDAIGMLRPTRSTGLWVQMLGRGTRPSTDTGKSNCLVLDFAGNTARLGPIDNPLIPKFKDPNRKPGDAAVKVCPKCETYNYASARWCQNCAHEFVVDVEKNIETVASDMELLTSDLPIHQTFRVDSVVYQEHKKLGSLPTLKATYRCGLKHFSQWHAFEHTGLAGHKAREWWRKCSMEPAPATVQKALELQGSILMPKTIEVWTNQKHPSIVGYNYV